MSRPRVPKYRLYKPKNLGLVVIDGKQHYLGVYGTQESLAEYNRLVQEHLAEPTSPVSRDGLTSGLTVSELIAAYWGRYVVSYYVKNGRPTSEQDNIRQALRFLRLLHGHTRAEDFSPTGLKAVRQAMIEAGRCRTLINKDVNRVRALFRWAVEHELVSVTVLHALQAVKGLSRGRTEAKEATPVGPVPVEVVEATLPHLPSPVAAMVRLQLLTGARPHEITGLRPCDVERGEGPVWIFRPAEHKTQHFGRDRLIPLGPRAREVLRPWLERDPAAYCFSPAEATAERNARCRARRRTPPRENKVPRPRVAEPRRPPGERYEKDAYRVAIQRACRKANVPLWNPGQLRHTAATLIRSLYGLEAAQNVLGHSRADVTQVYAERDFAKAASIMAEIG